MLKKNIPLSNKVLHCKAAAVNPGVAASADPNPGALSLCIRSINHNIRRGQCVRSRRKSEYGCQGL